MAREFALPSQTGNAGKVLTTDGTNVSWGAGGGGGSVTLEVNGIPNGSQTLLNLVGSTGITITDNGSGSVTFALGAITPSSVAATGTVTGSNLSGTNTGDQTNITGQSGTVNSIAGNLAAGSNVTITGSGSIASPYTISSGSTSQVTFKGYGATGNAQKVNDGVVTASSTTLTSASANFQTGDVGKVIAIPYAGANNGTQSIGQTFMTTIAAYVSATQVTLTAAPVTSVVGPRTLTDFATTIYSNVVTSATANFTAGDIGKKIVIPGAGQLIQGSVGSPQTCYITAITNSTTITVNRLSLATVTAQTVTIPGATVIWGTDDTTAIQNACAAGASQNKTVLIDPGRYLMTASVVPASNLKVQGNGAGNSVLQPVGSSGFAPFQLSGTITSPLPTLTDIQFLDFEIDGIGVTVNTYTTVSKGFYVLPTLRTIIRNCYVHDTSATGIGNDFMVEGQIINNTVEHCGRQVPEFGGGAGGSGIGTGTGAYSSERVLIMGNTVVDSGNNGIFVESQSSNILSRGIRIIGNYVGWSSVGSGIGDHATDGTIIQGNTVEFNPYGINAIAGFVNSLYSINARIQNNVVKDNATGIYYTWQNGAVTIEGNEITGKFSTSGGFGVFINSASGGTLTDCLICRNTIHNVAGTGINLGTYTFGTIRIEENHLVNNGFSTTSPNPAIYMTGATIPRLYIKNNIAYDNRGASQQQNYGVLMTSPTITKFVYESNDFSGNKTAPYSFGTATITSLLRTNEALVSTDLAAQTAALSSVAAYTNSQVAGTFRVNVYVDITAIATDVLNVQIAWTDENGTARTFLMPVNGTTSPNMNATGYYNFSPVDFRVSTTGSITVSTILQTGGGTITYDIGATIEQLR